MFGNFSEPEKNISHLNIQPGFNVADLGAGSGAYSVAIAKHLSGSGKVYAVEVQKNLLDTIVSNAKEAGVSNVDVLWGDIDEIGGTKIGDHACDVAVLANTFFQLEKREDAVKEIKRILKPGGKIMVIDWSDSFGHMGPSPEMVVKREEAKPYFIKEGFEMAEEFDAGPHHWGAVFSK